MDLSHQKVHHDAEICSRTLLQLLTAVMAHSVSGFSPRQLCRGQDTCPRTGATRVSKTVRDRGCVKTPKGRSRSGIVFYRRRGFRVVLQPLATTLVLEKKVILCVQRALAF